MSRVFRALPSKYGNVSRHLKDLRTKPESHWVRAGDRRALALFREMAARVPAYRDFLRNKKIKPAHIKRIADFRQVPTIDKENYLRRYPLAALCWDGKFDEKRWVIASTSGSTGEPFYFPREHAQDLQYARLVELYLRTNFRIQERSTLYIDAFPMGAWIGGLFTYEAVKLVADRGPYRLSVITPGIDKKEILNAVRMFGEKFDQLIIGCYGPFLKDALDDGVAQGLDWKKYHAKFVFSAEGFSEDFRDYVIRTAGLRNPYRDTLNHYGTVDLGTMSYETPLAVLVRRIAVRWPKLYASIFPVEHKLPTLTQYDPELFFFEAENGGLVCSAASGLPLVRYDLKDSGGVIGFDEMRGLARSVGVNLDTEARRAHLEDTVWRWPFVYVYERKDFSVSLYAFLIYPETVRKALHERQFERRLTGKFTMIVKFDKRQDQYLEINAELKARQKPSKTLARAVTEAVVRQLIHENSEYRKTASELGEKRVEPRIVFWPYEHTLYFMPGTKQKWVKKSEQ